MDRQSFMWEPIKCHMANIDFTQEMGVPIVIVYVYLWLPAASYECTNSMPIWRHCNNIFHSIHKKLLHKNCLYADYSQFVLYRENVNPRNHLSFPKQEILNPQK